MAILGGGVFLILLIIFGSYIVSKIFDFFVNNYVSKALNLTKTNTDNEILSLAVRPLHYFILFGGIYFSLIYFKLLNGSRSLVDKSFFVIMVFLVSLLVARFSVLSLNKWLKVQKRYQRTPRVINKVVSFTVYLIGVIVILSYFDVEITPLIATLGLGGLAIGLALQKTLADFFAGLHIVSDRPVNVGDFIELESGISGYVDDIGWRSTRIKTLPNKLVIIPNSKLAESVIVNDSLPEKETNFIVDCGVSYGSDLDKVEKVTLDVARKIQKKFEGAVTDFEPLLRFKNFGDSNIEFYVILRVEDPVKKYIIRHEFIKALKREYDKKKIEISWPVRKVYTESKKTSRKRKK